MAEYSSLKVPELKKLLADKGLPQTGNKADLIARLNEDDQKNAPADTEPAAADATAAPAAAAAPAQAPATDAKEDEINYTDDEDDAAKSAPAAESKESAPAATDAPAAEGAEAAAPAEEAPAAPAQSFSLGLTSTAAADEAKKRADRAKRFGITEDVDEEAKKRADRAKRFGLDEKDLAKGLDSALPDRPLKRGRGRLGEEGAGDHRGNKRQSLDRRGGRRGRGGRPNNPPRNEGGPRKGGSIMDDPAEKAKAEKRAARFASG